MAMQFAPDGRMFFNEVSKGTVRILKADGTLQEEPFAQLRVARRKEMGAIGLALHPDFATEPLGLRLLLGGEERHRRP